jgi:hypothetical protein
LSKDEINTDDTSILCDLQKSTTLFDCEINSETNVETITLLCESTSLLLRRLRNNVEGYCYKLLNIILIPVPSQLGML